MFRRFAGVAVALGALLGTGPAVAQAHPLLLQAAPQPGVVSPQSPDAIRLALSEAGVARGSEIAITDARGKRVPTSSVVATAGDRTFSVTPAEALPSAVYKVRWSVLGNDGHLVRGTFDFGVAGSDGAAPPGAEKLGGASAGGRGGENAISDGLVAVVGRWLGVGAASLLLGAFVLLTLLGRRRDDAHDAAHARVRAAAPLTWLLVGFAAVEGVLAAATSGTDGDVDLGLLTASPTGRADLVRLVLFAVVTAVLVALGERRDTRRAPVLATGATAILLTYAISGHVLSEPTVWTILDQGVHVLTAGLWLGGVLAIVLVTFRSAVPVVRAARAFAPVAAAALGVAIVTGVLAAVREVDAWYFLRWSDYGRVVIVKSILVALVALAGAVVFWRSRRATADAASGRLLRVEAFGVVAIVALAATMSGIAQGRGQPLPAERGTLFAGPAFGTALLAQGGAQMTLAPARRGPNVLTTSLPPEAETPKAVTVRLACACAPGEDVRATLEQGDGPAWSAQVELPRDGSWFAYVTVDGDASSSPVQLGVGVPEAPGSTPLDVLAVADLSGPDAERCRAHVLGVGLAIARINGEGGLDGGRKVTTRVLDSGGDVARATRLARDAVDGGEPLAAVGSCGTGGDAAVRVLQKAGVPVVIGDATVGPTPGNGVFRTAADPYAQGLSFAQIVKQRVLPSAPVGVRRIPVILGGDAASQRLLAGLRFGLRGTAAQLDVRRPGDLARRDLDGRDAYISQLKVLATVIDTPSTERRDVDALTELGREREGIVPAPVLLSERVLSERLIRSAGSLGRIGALQGVTEVSPSTADGILYRQSVPLLYRGELASLDGLRGYVSGLALRDAVRRAGVGHDAIIDALRRPGVFTNALLAPWTTRQPGAGSPATLAVQPLFLSPTVTPPSAGGTPRASAYFPDGTWSATSGLLGLGAQTGPAPQLTG